MFFSHLDFDHTSGIPLISGAKRFCAAKAEVEDSKRYFFRYVKENWKNVSMETFEFQDSSVGPVHQSYDVFGDDSVLLVSTPGHTHGHFSVKITGKNGKYIILAGDSVYTQQSIKKRIIPGFTVNQTMAGKSVDWICECAINEKCLLIAPNHDPEIIEQTLEV